MIDKARRAGEQQGPLPLIVWSLPNTEWSKIDPKFGVLGVRIESKMASERRAPILQWSHWQMQDSANRLVPADWIGVSKVMIGTSRPMSRQCSGSIHPSQEATQGAQPHVTQNEAGLSPMGRSASAGRRSV
ncbi:hypothetical protein GGX14DRAFT_394027 [Mycena pura]|uniref:Uncharacterized protein n=1 Tax=Mycena pura TaxID=153505 RepID=A0AAD6VN88_9AGAR|nr:hypothetical protein GGX14DRAFT_394027 [Mycena pura]